jgi:hypothetical protein
MLVTGKQVLTALEDRETLEAVAGEKWAATAKPPHEAGADGLGRHVFLLALGTDGATDLARFLEGQFAHPGESPWHPGG